MQLLEHIHLNVDSIAATEAFLKAAAPAFKRRGGGDAAGFGPWSRYYDGNLYNICRKIQRNATTIHIDSVFGIA